MRGHIETRYNGSHLIIIELGKDPSTGKRRRMVRAVRGNKRQAEREMVRLINELEQGTYVEPAKMTVGEYLTAWLADYCRSNLAPSTYASYERIVIKHLIPALGALRLASLQPMHIQGYYSFALERGRRDGKGGLSPRTVQYHHRVLREALQHALKWQLVPRNVADAVQAPRPRRQEMKVLDAEQLASLLAAAADTCDGRLIALAAYTGMRLGEVLGLRWQDIDFETGHIRVQQVLQRLPGQGFLVLPPKTERSRRQIAMSPTLADMLRKAKKEQAEHRLRYGKDYQDLDLVFCHPDGRPFDPSVVSQRFRRLADSLGFHGVRFHDLRHTHATLLLAQGVHPKVVQERLGHQSINITLDTYSHVLPGLQEFAATRFDEAIRNAERHKNGTTRCKK